MNKFVPFNLEFPALVSLVRREGKEQYESVPLFFNLTMQAHPRFEGSISKLKTYLQKIVKGFVLERDTADEMIWFRFNPTIDYQIFNLNVPLPGKKNQQGRFGIALFEVRNILFANLPHLGGFTYIIEKDKKSRFQLEQQATKIISLLLKRFQANDPNNFNFDTYTSPEKEFITTIEVQIQVEHDNFSFAKKSLGSFSDAFSSNEKMDGETEVWKISKNLNNEFPEKLGRAFYKKNLERFGILTRPELLLE